MKTRSNPIKPDQNPFQVRDSNTRTERSLRTRRKRRFSRGFFIHFQPQPAQEALAAEEVAAAEEEEAAAEEEAAEVEEEDPTEAVRPISTANTPASSSNTRWLVDFIIFIFFYKSFARPKFKFRLYKYFLCIYNSVSYSA